MRLHGALSNAPGHPAYADRVRKPCIRRGALSAATGADRPAWPRAGTWPAWAVRLDDTKHPPSLVPGGMAPPRVAGVRLVIAGRSRRHVGDVSRPGRPGLQCVPRGPPGHAGPGTLARLSG